MKQRSRFAVRKTVIQGIILPMVVFGTQQYLQGNPWTGAGAVSIALGVAAYDAVTDAKRIPWDADDLQGAAERVGDAEEQLADAVADAIEDARGGS